MRPRAGRSLSGWVSSRRLDSRSCRIGPWTWVSLALDADNPAERLGPDRGADRKQRERVNLRLRCLKWRAERRKLLAPAILVVGFEQLTWDSLDTPSRGDRMIIDRPSTASISGAQAGKTRDA